MRLLVNLISKVDNLILIRRNDVVRVDTVDGISLEPIWWRTQRYEQWRIRYQQLSYYSWFLIFIINWFVSILIANNQNTDKFFWLIWWLIEWFSHSNIVEEIWKKICRQSSLENQDFNRSKMVFKIETNFEEESRKIPKVSQKRIPRLRLLLLLLCHPSSSRHLLSLAAWFDDQHRVGPHEHPLSIIVGWNFNINLHTRIHYFYPQTVRRSG